MLEILLGVACVVIAYLLGSIPSGYLVARVRGVNIQQVGSGNIGATNVLRAVGVLPAIFVVILDPLKGALAVLLPLLLGLPPVVVAAAGLAVALGNNYNVFLKFRGGKGIATSLGVILVVSPLVGLLAAALGIYAIALGRLVSLGSLIGVAAAPVMLAAQGADPSYMALGIALALLATWRHRENIVRLAAGTENRIGRRKPPENQPPVVPPAADAGEAD